MLLVSRPLLVGLIPIIKDNIFRHMGIVSVSSTDDSDDQLSDVDSHMTLSSMGSHRAGIILGGFGDGQVEPEPNNDPARVSLNGNIQIYIYSIL